MRSAPGTPCAISDKVARAPSRRRNCPVLGHGAGARRAGVENILKSQFSRVGLVKGVLPVFSEKPAILNSYHTDHIGSVDG